ncbi:uncharacterized protein BDZ99DRAFT_464337 [Mytilinidion resinicola]|uniref:Uncharacterized protein n=1 Tax=Mytilinidion resinicola TaxID=574789 RepID=A0A6A6YI37_9PEZI|nr:uncharacterized protein BDZ99DRAFT_464337 [Mytilinidion resinicola]KAF2808461.1 hypothetical protein BDZ99DRAFT_464337 [Mytilinidion resinicola]
MTLGSFCATSLAHLQLLGASSRPIPRVSPLFHANRGMCTFIHCQKETPSCIVRKYLSSVTLAADQNRNDSQRFILALFKHPLPVLHQSEITSATP